MKRFGAPIPSAGLLVVTGCTNGDNCTEHYAAANGQTYPEPDGYYPGSPESYVEPDMPPCAARGLKEGLVDVVDGKPVASEAVYRLMFKVMMGGLLYSYCPY